MPSLRKALPIDARNYEKRLMFAIDRPNITDLDIQVYGPLDSELYSQGALSRFDEAIKNIGNLIQSFDRRLHSITGRLPYHLTQNHYEKGFGKRKSWKESERDLLAYLQSFANLMDVVNVEGVSKFHLCYHDQVEIPVEARYSNLENILNDRTIQIAKTRERADWLLDQTRKIFKHNEIVIKQENTSYNSERLETDETAYLSAEEFLPLIQKGIKIHLDPAHVALQLEAVRLAKKGKRLPSRLIVLEESFDGILPYSLREPTQSDGKYDIHRFVDVIGKENIVSVDVSQTIRGGEEKMGHVFGIGHSFPVNHPEGVVNFKNLKKLLMQEVVWIPEEAGTHIDPEIGINQKLLKTLDAIEKF